MSSRWIITLTLSSQQCVKTPNLTWTLDLGNLYTPARCRSPSLYPHLLSSIHGQAVTKLSVYDPQSKTWDIIMLLLRAAKCQIQCLTSVCWLVSVKLRAVALEQDAADSGQWYTSVHRWPVTHSVLTRQTDEIYADQLCHSMSRYIALTVYP